MTRNFNTHIHTHTHIYTKNFHIQNTHVIEKGGEKEMETSDEERVKKNMTREQGDKESEGREFTENKMKGQGKMKHEEEKVKKDENRDMERKERRKRGKRGRNMVYVAYIRREKLKRKNRSRWGRKANNKKRSM